MLFEFVLGASSKPAKIKESRTLRIIIKLQDNHNKVFLETTQLQCSYLIVYDSLWVVRMFSKGHDPSAFPKSLDFILFQH